MGRTVPTFRNVIETFNREWNDFKRALCPSDRDAFEELMNHARRHATAGTNRVNPNPLESMLISILVEHEKTLRKLWNHVERGNF